MFLFFFLKNCVFLCLIYVPFVSILTVDDYRAIVGILYTAHSLFKKYRYEFKSQKLWAEIKFVLDTLSSPLTTLFDVSIYSILSGDIQLYIYIYIYIEILCIFCNL